tara:strand:- start:607 stop:885 length:279 start_codon:yes stop_codon:yes gene_type:complete
MDAENHKNGKKVVVHFQPNDNAKFKGKTVRYLGKRRYPSKNAHYRMLQSPTENYGDKNKYRKTKNPRAVKVTVPRQNLLVMKWNPPIRITFD